MVDFELVRPLELGYRSFMRMCCHRIQSHLMMTLLVVFCGVRADNVPVAPLLPDQSESGGPVYTLETRSLQVTIVPSEGGITSLRLWGEEELLKSPLRIEPTLQNTPSTSEVPWESRGWRTYEGNQVVMLTRSLGPPLSCRIIQLIELPAEGTHLRVTTRITGTGPGDQRLLKPTAQWTLKRPEHMWTRDPYHILAWQHHYTAWSVNWHIEDLTSALEGGIFSHMTQQHVEMQSSPGHLQLPPQGWTLICTLALQVNRGNPDQPAIEIIHTWPPSLN